MGFDQFNRLIAKPVAIRIFYPHMQQADKEQMRIHRQLRGIMG